MNGGLANDQHFLFPPNVNDDRLSYLGVQWVPILSWIVFCWSFFPLLLHVPSSLYDDIQCLNNSSLCVFKFDNRLLSYKGFQNIHPPLFRFVVIIFKTTIVLSSIDYNTISFHTQTATNFHEIQIDPTFHPSKLSHFQLIRLYYFLWNWIELAFTNLRCFCIVIQ